MRNHPKYSIQIISRYIPLVNRAGHFTYLLDIMRYLSQNGYELELDVLNPWFHPDEVPQYIREIADVFIMPSSFLRPEDHTTSKTHIKTLFWPWYNRLPSKLLHPLRSLFYRLRGRSLPGIHKPDAMATEPEIAFIAQSIKQRQFDIMLVTETFLGNILTICKDDDRILKMVLAFDLHHQRSAKFRQSHVRSDHSEWTRHKEIAQLTWADVVLAVHEEDASTLRDMIPQAEIFCVPMAAKYHAHSAGEQLAGRCLFVASDIDHNVSGLRWFLEEIWPKILHKYAAASLHICGSVCGKFRQSYQNVWFLGRVETLDDEYGETSVCLIPLLAGSGLKIKLVEALSHGRACVSTSVGTQGVGKLSDKAILVADTAEEFANAVCMLLSNSEKRATMEEEARHYVTTYLSPDNVYQPLMNRLNRHYRK